MTEVRIRNVDEWVVEWHRQSAKRAGQTLESTLRELLTGAAMARKRSIAEEMRATYSLSEGSLDQQATEFGVQSTSEAVRFQGRPEIAAGHFDFRSRVFVASLGRFLSPDHLGFGGLDNNLYRALRNSPANYRDPFGTVSAPEYSIIASNIAIGALVGAAGGALQEFACFVGHGDTQRTINIQTILDGALLGAFTGGIGSIYVVLAVRGRALAEFLDALADVGVHTIIQGGVGGTLFAGATYFRCSS